MQGALRSIILHCMLTAWAWEKSVQVQYQRADKEPNVREQASREGEWKFPGVRERREEEKQFLKIKRFLSLELRMKSND